MYQFFNSDLLARTSASLRANYSTFLQGVVGVTFNSQFTNPIANSLIATAKSIYPPTQCSSYPYLPYVYDTVLAYAQCIQMILKNNASITGPNIMKWVCYVLYIYIC